MDAFRKGNTFVTDRPIIDFRVEEALPGDEVRIDRSDRRLNVVARTYRDRRLGSPSLLQVISQGEVVGEVRSDDQAKNELDLSFDMAGGDGFWIAARAESHDGTFAHTTPIYVVRSDLRFWRYQQVRELIHDRGESLQEIESIVSVAARLNDHLESTESPLTSRARSCRSYPAEGLRPRWQPEQSICSPTAGASRARASRTHQRSPKDL